MAQDTSATSLTTTAAATSRVIVYKFFVDWAGAGWAASSLWTDETGYFKTARGDMQATSYAHSIAAVGKSVADLVYVTCRNPEASGSYSGLRFSPTNASGPLYGYIGAGKIFMTRCIVEMGFESSGTPERLKQISGYIVDVKENLETREVTFEIRDRGAALSLTKAQTILYQDTDAKTYAEALCLLETRDPVATTDQKFSQGMVVTPWMWMDGESLWEELAMVAEAQLGRVWFDKDGDLHLDDGGRFVSPDDNSWDDPTVIQATLRVDSFRDCSPRVDVDNVYNEIVVEYTPFYLGTEQVMYSESDTLVIKPYAFSSDGRLGHSISHKIATQYPAYQALLPSADAGTVVAVTAGGVDISDDITVSLGDYGATFAEYTIYNANTEYTAFITKLEVVGIPLLSGDTAKYETEDATSIAQFGRKTWTVRNPYIQTRRHAEMVGDFMLSRYKSPITHLTIRGIPARPWLEVGDRVRIVEDLEGIAANCLVGRIEWAFSARNPLYTQTLHVMPYNDIFPYSNYFIIGTSAYGTGTGRGRLFW